MRQFDERTQQRPVTSYAAIDSLLQSFPTVNFNQLDSSYCAYSESSGEFVSMLKGKRYCIVRGDSICCFVAGRFRVLDLLPEDRYYQSNLDNPAAKHPQYWLVDKTMLYRLLDLIHALTKLGHDPYAITLKCGHRHPQNNREVGGASKSRHIAGEAVDLHIGDINQDGKTNAADKQIVLDLLNNNIIGDSGGIGRYPGTQSVHFDVRGYRARWDSY